MFPTNQNFVSANGGLSNGNNPCFPMYLTVAPTTQTIYAPYGIVQIGQIAIVPATGAWICIGLVSSSTGITATWEQMVSSTGDVLSVTGTANQILATPNTGNVVLSLIGPYTPATYTAHGVLIGEGTSSIVATAAGTDGQVLTANTGADPAFAAIGTKSGLTAHGVVLAEGASAFTASAAGTNGQLLIGGTLDPAFATITTTTGIAFTTGNNTLAVDTKTYGFAVVDQTSGSAALAAQTMYVTDNGASLVTYTLPATVARGTSIKIVGLSAGGWKIAQNAGQTISLNASVTTSGITGSVSSTNKNQSITLIATDATTNGWVIADSSGGALTFV